VNKRELRVAVRTRNGIPDAGDGLSAHGVIDECVTAERRWPWLLASAPLTFSTTTGIATPAVDYAQIHKLVIGGKPARMVPLADYLEEQMPFVWTDLGNTIGLYPIPGTVPVATLWYFQNEPDLLAQADTATPILPAVHHQILVARASYHLNVRRGDNGRIAQDLTEYQSGLRNLMQASARAFGPRTIRSAFRDKSTASW
jgi:hypothetical protein